MRPRFSDERADWVQRQFMAGVPAKVILGKLREADAR